MLINQLKEITSLKSELNETRAMGGECESNLEYCEEEVQAWKEEARERKVDATNLSRSTEILWWNRNGKSTPVCRFGGRLSRATEKTLEAGKASSKILKVKLKTSMVSSKTGFGRQSHNSRGLTGSQQAVNSVVSTLARLGPGTQS